MPGALWHFVGTEAGSRRAPDRGGTKSALERGPVTASRPAMTKSAQIDETIREEAATPATAPSVDDSPRTTKTRVRGARAKNSNPARPKAKATLTTTSRGDGKRVPSRPKRHPTRSTGQLETLLVGAGVGAAVTLSIVMLRGKNERNPTLAAALVKVATYAIGRVSGRASLTSLVARAIGSVLV